MILARRWLERLEREEAKKNHELAIDNAFEQSSKYGEAMGEMRVQLKWEGWNYRRLLAKAEGRDFNEPPPSLDDDE